MNLDERYKITSNSFADLLVNYQSDNSILENFPLGTINYIDNNYAVLHIPAEELTVNSISKFGYPAIPCCYSLQSNPTRINKPVTIMQQETDNSLSGSGVLIGVVDTGIDYLSPLFQTSSNNTKILSIWDQTIESDLGYPEDFYYGTEYSEEQINLALESENPYNIVPSVDEVGHGTMLASIAGGSHIPEHDFRGIAYNCQFVIVKLKEAKQNLKEFFYIPNDAITYQENDIMLGVSYLIRYATKLNRPISILIGVGTSQGDHGGRGFLSSFLSNYSNYSGLAITVPAGNEANRGHHYYGEINPTVGSDTVELNVGTNEKGFSMEIYGNPPSNFWVEIIAPNNDRLGRVIPSIGGNKTTQVFYLYTTIVIDNQIKEDYSTREQLVIIRFNNPIPGIWRFVLSNESDLSATFHVWLPTEAFITKDTYLLDSNNNTTITSPGNAQRLITVTAYNPTNDTLYFYASKGNTVLNEVKPDITAPGVDILVPVNSSHTLLSSGTSLGAAYTAGTVALLFQWGIVEGNGLILNSAQIKKALIAGANRNPNLDYPNPDWGYGVVDIDSALLDLEQDLGSIS